MQVYLANKRFFTQGVFYGLDEQAHAHTLPDAGACVINCFNLAAEPAERTLRFRLADIGLSAGPKRVTGAESSMAGEVMTLRLMVPAMGHQLVTLTT